MWCWTVGGQAAPAFRRRNLPRVFERFSISTGVGKAPLPGPHERNGGLGPFPSWQEHGCTGGAHGNSHQRPGRAGAGVSSFRWPDAEGGREAVRKRWIVLDALHSGAAGHRLAPWWNGHCPSKEPEGTALSALFSGADAGGNVRWRRRPLRAEEAGHRRSTGCQRRRKRPALLLGQRCCGDPMGPAAGKGHVFPRETSLVIRGAGEGT